MSSSSSSNSKTNPKKPIANNKKDMKKKTDGDDEESKGFVEKTMSKENNDKIDLLSNQVSAIKNISHTLGSQMKEEKTVLNTLDSGFDKTKMMAGKALSKLDEMVSKGSGSIWCYVALFTIMFLAILYKLG